jgi:multiple sugar transport system ATP-binding protein
MAISLEGVNKVYPSGFQAVLNLNLEIKDGEFFTLLGPSGCGKTTTLRMIAGLETSSSGRICIGGKDFTHTHPRDRDVAMVFQSYALYPHMTVRQNLALNLEIRKNPRDEIKTRVDQVAKALGIETLLDKKPGQLSGGQRQRVALGRALIRRPAVFLMDEPLSNLDLKLRERTRTELKKLHEHLRVTTVYVTHDQAEALVLSDRIGIMRDGILLQVGTPQEIYDRPASAFVAKFVGTPSINLFDVNAIAVKNKLCLKLDGDLSEIGGAILECEPDALDYFQERRSLTLGIRPESVALFDEDGPGRVAGNIELIEPMGSVNHVVLTIDGAHGTTSDSEPFIAVVRSNEAYFQGNRIWISVRPDRLVLFERGFGPTVAVLSGNRTWQASNNSFLSDKTSLIGKL